MKKTILFVTLIVVGLTAAAQSENVKKVAEYLKGSNLDLGTAKRYIDMACVNKATKDEATTWFYAALIYRQIGEENEKPRNNGSWVIDRDWEKKLSEAVKRFWVLDARENYGPETNPYADYIAGKSLEEWKKARETMSKKWVDMGVRDENGDMMYWASSDFVLYNNGTVGFANYGESGSEVGWGDISGEKSGSNLSQFGGQNPPGRIEGDPKYDIVTAKLGSPHRLPTQKEIQALMDNCDVKTTTIHTGEPQGTNGLPSWVHGQWMSNDAVMLGNTVVNSALSVKVDGGLASWFTSNNTLHGDYWEGPYIYDDGRLVIGKLTLIVDKESRTLKDRNGRAFSKISSSTSSNKVTGVLFTSRINGNTLLFAMPPSVTAINSGKYYIAFRNSQEISYWTGTLFNKDNDCAVGMTMVSDGCGAVAQPRSYHKRIRAVKVDVGSRAWLTEEKRVNDSVARVNRQKEITKIQKWLEARTTEEKAKIDAFYAPFIGTWKAEDKKYKDVIVVIDTNHMYVKTKEWDGYDGLVNLKMKKGTKNTVGQRPTDDHVEISPSSWSWSEEVNLGSQGPGYPPRRKTLYHQRNISIDKENNLWISIKNDRTYETGKMEKSEID